MLKSRALALVAALSATLCAHASEVCAQNPGSPGSGQDNLEPDRPDVTNGTHIVDVGLLQIEAGGVWNRGGADRHSTGTPVTLRLGLSEWLEARISGDGLLSVTDPSGTQSGLGNIQLGAKLRLWADPGGVPVLSILPTI